MKTKLSLLFCILLLLPLLTFSQTWPKVYTMHGNHHSFGIKAYESYDGGILLISQNHANGVRPSGWLLKTDANGDILWDRVIGNWFEQYPNGIANMEVTSDSGVIIAMGTRYFGPKPKEIEGDQVFVKLNKCGQLDWCTLINMKESQNYGQDVVPTKDGYIGLYRNSNLPKNTFGLVKMDFNGQVQWLFTYNNDTIVDNYPLDLLAFDDGSVMASGYCYYDDGQSPLVKLKPLKLHIADDGDVISWQAAHYDNGILRGVDYETIKDNRGNLYSAGYTTQTSIDKRSLRKQRVNGTGLEYYVTMDTLISSYNFLDWMADSSLVITGSFVVIEGQWYRVPSDVSIIDTLGNVLYQRILLDNFWSTTYRVATTRDNKILATGSADEGNPYGPPGNTFLFKLTSTLEDDVYDPTPRVYDYACPGGVIPHDTIGMEQCDIVVSAAHLATLPDVAVMEVFPNPVSDVFYVRLPEFIAIRNNNKGLKTALYQSNYQQQSILQVFDLNGRFITEQKLTQGQLVAEFNASHWPPGMYLLRLVYKNNTVGSAKVVK